VLVAPIRSLIELGRDRAMLRQRAVPFAVVVSEAAELPLWKREIDQRERGVGRGTGLDQSIETCFRDPGQRRKSATRLDEIGPDAACNGRCTRKLLKQRVEPVVVCQMNEHDTNSTVHNMGRSPYRSETERAHVV